MTEYFWLLKVNDKTERVEWDSISETLIAPISVSETVGELIDDGEIVSLTAVGPKFVASLDDSLPAYATILTAINLNNFEILDSSEVPLDPEAVMEI